MGTWDSTEGRENPMKLAVLVFALCGCAMGAQFMAPPAGSMQEIAAQEQYFTKTSKLVLGLQQAYYWQHYGQIEALKSYKAGRIRDINIDVQATQEAVELVVCTQTGEVAGLSFE